MIRPPVSIGRRDDNDIVIDNMAVSGHHSVIEFEEPNYYVLADLESLNGTFLNQKKVDRERVFEGDAFIVGKHLIEFQDLRPEEERPSREATEEAEQKEKELRETMVLDTDAQKELLAKQASEKGIEEEDIPEKPKKIELFGSLTIISGGTPEIIDLNKRLTVLGKSDEADVKCGGLLVGKTAGAH